MWKTTVRNEDTTTVIPGNNLECIPARFDSALNPNELPLRLHGSGWGYDAYSRLRPLPGMPIANRCYCVRDFEHSPGRQPGWFAVCIQPNSKDPRCPDSTPPYTHLIQYFIAPTRLLALSHCCAPIARRRDCYLCTYLEKT